MAPIIPPKLAPVASDVVQVYLQPGLFYYSPESEDNLHPYRHDFFGMYASMANVGWWPVRGASVRIDFEHNTVTARSEFWSDAKDLTGPTYGGDPFPWMLLQRSSGEQVLLAKDTGYGIAGMTVEVSLNGSFVGGDLNHKPTANDSFAIGLSLPSTNTTWVYADGVWKWRTDRPAYYIGFGKNGYMKLDTSHNLHNYFYISDIICSMSNTALYPHRTVMICGVNERRMSSATENYRPTLITAGHTTDAADLDGHQRCGNVWVDADNYKGYAKNIYITGLNNANGQVANNSNLMKVYNYILPFHVPDLSSCGNFYAEDNIQVINGGFSAPIGQRPQDFGFDFTPPTFAGITSATAQSTTDVLVAWTAGTDETSAQGALTYQVHYSTSASQTFATRVETAPGATSVVIGGLTPSTQYYFRVRCVDEMRNADTNSVELGAMTHAVVVPDTTPPTVTVISPASASELSADTPLVIRVDDNVGNRRIVLHAHYDGALSSRTGPPLPPEIVHDGDTFQVPFTGSSRNIVSGTRTVVTIVRTHGWPRPTGWYDIVPVDIKAIVLDTSGNDGT